MQKQHKQAQIQGRKQPTAAQLHTGTGPTFGGAQTFHTTSTRSAQISDEVITQAPAPALPPNNINSKNPVTFEHLKKLWLVLAIAIPAFVSAVWYASYLFSKVNQHESIISEVKSKTETIEKEVSTTSAQVQTISSQVNKLEDRMYNASSNRKLQ